MITGNGYKTTKVSLNSDVKSNGRATVEDEEDDDVVAGPELPPDEDSGGLDDDEGRFFGGGITTETAEVLDFIDERDKDELGVSLKFVISCLRIAKMNARIQKKSILHGYENLH